MNFRLIYPALHWILIMMLLPAVASAQATIPVPAAPAINAGGYLLQDFKSGHVLAEKNAGERLEPASLTKLMTAYIVFTELRSGAVSLDDQVTVSEKAWRITGSRMFIEVNTRVSIEELLKGMIIQSGNDASIALAEHVAGSEDAFAALMNNYAQSLGMNDTNYVNSTGMPDADHYTTAHDLAILARALIREFPEYYQWYSEREYTFNGITQHNRNRLLWRDASVDGLKTGHTKSAGYCLITSAQRDNMRLITVVLGTSSEEARLQETQKLLNYGFRFFETHLLHAAGAPLTSARVWQGHIQELPLNVEDDLYVTIPRNQFDSLDTVMAINSEIVAPVQRGQAMGSVRIMLGDAKIAERPLVAGQDIEEGSLTRRISDRIMMRFQ